jgi:hypothetical protein
MIDFFGDGWNGGTYSFYDQDNNLIAEGTMLGGEVEVVGFCMLDACYTFVVEGGSFESEIGWTLSGIEGGPLSGFAPVSVTIGVGGANCNGVDCLGDFNGDDMRSTADLLIFLADFGCLIGCTADMDGDDTVSTSDLLIFLTVFGVDCP